jgi:phosphoribosylanthranilate isomerase
MSVKIKVCGLTQKVQIEALAAMGVDFGGLIFHPKSPRYVDAGNELGLQVTEASTLQRVGIFVNTPVVEILSTARSFHLRIVQLHGDESESAAIALKAAGLKVFKAFHVDEQFDFQKVLSFTPHCEAFVFDTKGKHYGGNGKKFNWEVLQHYHEEVPFLLSGGLTPKDAEAIKAFKHPKLWGVDLNSGFENAPGDKDLRRVERFLAALA